MHVILKVISCIQQFFAIHIHKYVTVVYFMVYLGFAHLLFIEISDCFIQVADVKANIEAVQGSDVYPASQQMLIHQGKVLKDGTTLDENKVAENSFVVVMLSKVYIGCVACIFLRTLFFHHISLSFLYLFCKHFYIIYFEHQEDLRDMHAFR